MAIPLPSRLTTSHIFQTLKICQDIISANGGLVTLDAGYLCFIDPFSLSLLASAGEKHSKNGGHVEIINLPGTLLTYLTRMDFLKLPWIKCDDFTHIGRNDQRGSLVELVSTNSTTNTDELATSLTQAILGQISDLDGDEEPDEMSGYTAKDKLSIPLCHTFSEIILNSVTHGHRHGYKNSTVWISAQYYARSDEILIGIVDNGCGILESLRTHPKLENKTDEAAILLALQPGISCNRDVGVFEDATNAGAGLTIVYRLARESLGSMLIASGGGVVSIVSKSDAITNNVAHLNWQGTALGLKFKRSNLANVDFRNLMPIREIGRVAPDIRFE